MKNEVVISYEPLTNQELYFLSLITKFKLDLPLDKTPDVLHVLEYGLPGYFKSECIYYIIPDNEWQHGDRIPSVCIPEYNIIFIKESTYAGAMNGNTEDLRTIWHEICHLILHPYMKEISSCNTIQNRQEAGINPDNDAESITDRFMAIMICPSNLLITKDTEDMIHRAPLLYRDECTRLSSFAWDSIKSEKEFCIINYNTKEVHRIKDFLLAVFWVLSETIRAA